MTDAGGSDGADAGAREGADAGGSDSAGDASSSSDDAGDSDGRPCPLCGASMRHRHCKYVCPNHGVVYDCSDTFY